MSCESNPINSFQMNDKTCIVTGATKGIGRGIAEILAQAGANVVVVSRNAEDCKAVANELSRYPGKMLACPTDVTNLSAVQMLMDQTVKAFGRIDVLVNNAGAAITKRAQDLTEEDWDRVLNLDLKAVFFCAQAAGRQMIEQGGGKIVNIASALGIVGEKAVLPYCVAKGGVIQMTRALALEWARYHINVNALCPGYVITPINQDVMNDEKVSSRTLKKIAFRRFGTVDEIANAALFLCSDASSYMTGSAMTVDGGWTAE